MTVKINIEVKIPRDFLNEAWMNFHEEEMHVKIAQAIAKEAVIPRFTAYPMQTHAKQPFVSDKQRRYFFAALKKGKIKIPYQRTQKLANSWRVSEGRSEGLAMVVRVSNTRRGARFVIGHHDEQSRYHADNWPNVEDVAQEIESTQARDIADRIAREEMQKAGLA